MKNHRDDDNDDDDADVKHQSLAVQKMQNLLKSLIMAIHHFANGSPINPIPICILNKSTIEK